MTILVSTVVLSNVPKVSGGMPINIWMSLYAMYSLFIHYHQAVSFHNCVLVMTLDFLHQS